MQPIDAPTETQAPAFVRKGPAPPATNRTTALPTDLLHQGASRLQALALLYAFTFFMAAFFPALVMPHMRPILFAHPVSWLPGAISIAVALVVAWVLRTIRLRPGALTVVTLVFEIAGSYGIAAAE